jgi:hypothetical protein
VVDVGEENDLVDGDVGDVLIGGALIIVLFIPNVRLTVLLVEDFFFSILFSPVVVPVIITSI